MSLTFRALSGAPYNITTGFDENGDGIFNDRPAGVGRNSATGAASWDLGGRISYAIGFGQAPAAPGAGGPNIVIRTGSDSTPGGFGGGADDKHYKAEIYLSVQNLANHANYTGYSGVMTSPFFGQATNVLNPRKAEVGVRFAF